MDLLFWRNSKKHSEYKYIPIVIATTEDNVENEKRCLEYGVWEFYTEVIPPGDHLVSCHERYQKEQTARF